MIIKLDVPYKEKDKAKNLGAKWNPSGKFWYVENCENLIPFRRWISDPLPTQQSDTPLVKARSSDLNPPPDNLSISLKDEFLIFIDGNETLLQFWTDGCCEPNPGLGGWGVCCSDGREVWGGNRATTNNQMEMQAVIEAIKMSSGQPCVIYTDSQYVQKGVTQWMAAWKRKGWQVKKKNLDLWREIDALLLVSQCKVEWVRGHNGNAGNEYADYLASLGRKKGLNTI